MSLLNLWVSPDRALVAVDTLCADFHGERGEVSKLVPLAHANAVLAGRGNMEFLFILFAAAQNVHDDFDAVAEALPALLPPTYDVWASGARRLGATEEQIRAGQQVALVGWSRIRQRMCGTLYTQVPHAEGFTADPLGEPVGARVAPGGGAYPETWQALDTHAGLLALAREQTRIGNSSGAVIGGRLIVAELTRAGMSLAEAGSL